MSKYTTEVRFICENAAGMLESAGYSGIDSILDRAIPSVFSFDFPIFDEAYRNVLCRKILKHYYTREICAETVGLWKLWLDTRMNEIMPYYNQLYKSELIEFNPLYDVDVTTNSKRDNDTTGTEDYSNTKDIVGSSETNTERTSVENGERNTNANSVGEGEGLDLHSDTPQGPLHNVEAGEYLSDARKTTGSDSRTDTSNTTDVNNVVDNGNAKNDTTSNETASGNHNRTAKTTEEYLNTVKGKQGSSSYSKLLKEFRETFLNIDKMIIDELGDLFINLW